MDVKLKSVIFCVKYRIKYRYKYNSHLNMQVDASMKWDKIVLLKIR